MDIGGLLYLLDAGEEVAKHFEISISLEAYIPCVIALVVAYVLVVAILYFKDPYGSAKKNYFSALSLGVLIAIAFFTLILIEPVGASDTFMNIASDMAAGVIIFAAYHIFGVIEEHIKNKYEDSEKLSQEYEVLAERYNVDNLVTAVNSDGSKIRYPVACLGTGMFSLDEGVGDIIINDNPDSKYQLPTVIADSYIDLFSVHDTSVIYNNINVRTIGMRVSGDKLNIDTARTTYYDSLVTNRACDYEISEGISVRELLDPGPQLTPLDKSLLSNHLGYNAFIESSDGYIVFVKRSNDLSIGKNTFGDSIGASIKGKYAINPDGRVNFTSLRNSILKEIVDELKIEPEDIINDSVTVISAYRDCVECGKPQLLVYGRSKLKASEISTTFTCLSVQKNKNKRKNRKNKSNGIASRVMPNNKNRKIAGFFDAMKKEHYARIKDKKESKVLEDGTKLVWVKREALLDRIKYYYDGILFDNTKPGDVIYYEVKPAKDIATKSRKNATEGAKTKRKVYNEDRFKMVPSASAVIWLWRQYSYNVIESMVRSKTTSQGKCEDIFYAGKDVVAVIDGVTSKDENNKGSGLVAARKLYSALCNGVSIESPEVFFGALNDALGENNGKASVIAYIPSKNEVWSYGDCQCLIDGVRYKKDSLKDIELSKKRAAIVEEAIKNRKMAKSAMDADCDIGRAAITKELEAKSEYENDNSTNYGYPVINGDKICPDMIDVYKVPAGSEVVLASDGYPTLLPTLEMSEAALKRELKQDPTCSRINIGTKGLVTGNESYDDRCYVRIKG